MLVSNARTARRGTHAVEMAFVLIPLLMFFFGIFEYGRFFLYRNLVNNAAREACRYATANNVTDPAINTTVQTLVNNYMAGGNSSPINFASFTVTLSGTSVSTGANYTGNNVSNLQPGDWMSVSITSTFKFIGVPLIPGPSTAPMNSQCTMLCEGGV